MTARIPHPVGHMPNDDIAQTVPGAALGICSMFASRRKQSPWTKVWKFRGRLRFVTYNPTKRARFGLKVCKLSVSTGPMCGYISAFRFYTGQDKGEVPASHKAVSDLIIVDVLDKGYNFCG